MPRSSAFASDNYWQYFLQMADVLGTLLRVNPFLPEPCDSVNGFCFSVRLHDVSQEVLQFVPQQLNGVKVWRFSWCYPPIDVVFLEEGSRQSAGMFRIIVLLKPITVWEGFLNEWQQPIGHNLRHEELSIHDAFEDHQLSIVGPRFEMPAQT